MVARLRIREVWKGEARAGEQLLVYWADSECPPPPYYKEGRAVVTFLSYATEKWETVAGSYGTRYPTGDDEVAAYRQAVVLAKEAQHIRSQARRVGNRLSLEPMRVDWQVQVSAHPATRWDGMYGLAGGADVIHDFYDLKGRRPLRLTEAQRARFARGFVEHPPLDSSLPTMLKVLHGYADKQVDQAAAQSLETMFNEGRRQEWVVQAFDLLRERHGEKPKPREPLSDEEALSEQEARDEANGASASSIQREWARFKKRHRLTPTSSPLSIARRRGDSPF
ncbi:hypothetical protein NVS55_31630 [Myxococcus stipitatus]|uniref:hypothetical protein n=1 Tax=Myxococcus stipitatus TaxID=83455 RepID=UPI003144FA2A